MALTVVKMLASVVAILVYALAFEQRSRSFVYLFFAAYLFYTVFETIYLVRLSRRASAPQPTT